jgi:hypothetical protein
MRASKNGVPSTLPVAVILAGSGEAMAAREEWRPVLEAQVRRWSQIPWEQVVSLLRETQAYEATLDTKKFRVAVDLLEENDASIQLSVAVDDGALTYSALPLCRSVVLSKMTRRERRKVAR